MTSSAILLDERGVNIKRLMATIETNLNTLFHEHTTEEEYQFHLDTYRLFSTELREVLSILDNPNDIPQEKVLRGKELFKKMYDESLESIEIIETWIQVWSKITDPKAK